MLLEKLKKYCLQYLEQSDDTDVMESEISDLKEDDTYAEYLKNMDHSIYMGLVRYATSNILPLCEFHVTTNGYANLVDSKGKRLFHKIKEVYAVDRETNDMLPNVRYTIIGNKVFIRNMRMDLYDYFVLYHPTVNDLETYLTDTIDDINYLDLSNLGNGLSIPDEMAINLKYLVYSDMKVEESATMANLNKNYFESYLSEMATNQVSTNQVEIITREWGDTMGESSSSSGNPYWDNIVGDEA